MTGCHCGLPIDVGTDMLGRKTTLSEHVLFPESYASLNLITASLGNARPELTSRAFNRPEITGQETWGMVLKETSSTREFNFPVALSLNSSVIMFKDSPPRDASTFFQFGQLVSRWKLAV